MRRWRTTFRGVLLIVLSFFALATASFAQLGGTAGAFTRLGFGARGMGMGNALSTITDGAVSVYYNPALSPFQQGHFFFGSYSILSLDRKLNQIAYTQSLTIMKKGAQKSTDNSAVQTRAGFSIGWINAGDANVMGYDNDGYKTRMLSVFENQFYFNFGNRFTDKLSFGFTAKYYYSGLYDKITTTSFGFDLGALYLLNDHFHISIVAQELLSKYRWDTSNLYGPEHGNTTQNPFARIFKAGCGYYLPDTAGVIAAEIEMYDGKTILGRIGGEYHFNEYFSVRAGVERIDFSKQSIDPRPTFGVSISQPLASFRPTIHYAFILEPVAPTSTHVISFALNF
jgi:hypothetical protein